MARDEWRTIWASNHDDEADLLRKVLPSGEKRIVFVKNFLLSAYGDTQFFLLAADTCFTIISCWTIIDSVSFYQLKIEVVLYDSTLTWILFFMFLFLHGGRLEILLDYLFWRWIFMLNFTILVVQWSRMYRTTILCATVRLWKHIF